MKIDGARLQQSITELAQIGGFTDERTGLRGVNRLALTDADRDGRLLVKRWFEEAGLQVRVDRIGNVYGRRAGTDDNLACVMSGSHIDSVPTGGAFDGVLGVLGALEVVRSLNDQKIKTRRPIEIAYFTDEEGARFGTDMLGSAVAAGRLTLEDAWALTDADGKSVKAELERIGFLGEASERLEAPHAYVEVHIEQGPILEAAGVDLGVVTGVQAISWQQLTIMGKAAHAGTTPMALRKDAGLAVARVNVELHRMVNSGDFGQGFRVTMGHVALFPNRINIVPARAQCTVDLRHPIDEMMQKAESHLANFVAELSEELGVQIESKQTARTERVSFAAETIAVVRDAMNARGYRSLELLSGAGHDAQEIAALCPTAMIFIPGKYDGISHNPREYSTPEACEKGVTILADAILRLAE